MSNGVTQCDTLPEETLAISDHCAVFVNLNLMATGAAKRRHIQVFDRAALRNSVVNRIFEESGS